MKTTIKLNLKNLNLDLFSYCTYIWLLLKNVFNLYPDIDKKEKLKKNFIIAFFDTKLILSQHPQQFFYNFKNPFLKIFGKSINFLIFWMFLHHPSKFGEFSLKIGGEIICQS